jgi:hypothetical protein
MKPNSRFFALVLLAASAACALVLGCKRDETPPPGYPYPAQGSPYPPAGYGGQPGAATPGVPAPVPGAPAPAPGVPGFPAAVGADPINNVDLAFLRAEATGILAELVAALPPLQQSRVAAIPMVVDSTPGEVNAFATCSKSGRAAMAITDGLLEIQAFLARARAHDEMGGTRKVDEYIALIARNQRPKQPVVRPAAGFFDPALDANPQKLARQRQVLDEELAFVLGHELAHHYLGHLPCTAAGALPVAEIARVLTDAVPGFNQPNELAADVAGLNDALTAGARRNGYHFTETGALLTMQFFSGLDQLTPTDILFSFERSHPSPALRVPIIQQTANAWRTTGGRGLPYPFF